MTHPMVRLEIERQSMDALAKRGAMRRLRQVSGRRLAALRAPALQPPVAFDDRLDLREINLVIFPDHRTCLILGKRQTAMEAVRRAVILNNVRRIGQTARMSLVAGRASAGPRALPFCLAVRDGGFDDVRDVLSGRCIRSTNSTNSGFVSPSSSARFMDRMNHRPTSLARGWVVTWRE